MNGNTARIGTGGMLAILSMLAGCAAARPASVTIVRDGKPTATIVVAADAGEFLAAAVKDLQTYIKKMSGAELPIAHSAEGTGNVILVGRQPVVNELLGDLDAFDLGPDGIIIKSLPGKLILTGKSGGYIHEDLGLIRGQTDAGTPNAVYYFLEALGCRWYMPGEDGEVVPNKPTLTISMDVTSKPDFRGRWIGCSAAYRMGGPGSKSLKEFYVWRDRNRTSHNTYYQAHSMGGLFSKAKYTESHPEYFALLDGKRQLGKAAALCFSNPDVIDIVATNLIKGMMRYSPLLRSHSLGQSDGPAEGWCKCENCLAAYGDKTFLYADRVHAAVVGRGPSDKPVFNAANGFLKFANAVAERAEKANPDLLLTYYAVYNIPGFPEVKPRDSVLPVMCHLAPQNEYWRRQVSKWASISKHLYYYTYMGYRIDFPKLGIADDIRWCYEHKGIAMYLEHDAHSPINMVNLYLGAKALWDTKVDSKAVLREFYSRYYGAAKQPMRTFYETFYELTREGADNHPDCLFAYPDALTPEVAAKCRGYITLASSLATTPVVKRRIESISRYWRATELHVDAQHALAEWRKDKTAANSKAAKEALTRTIDYINSVANEFALQARILLLTDGMKELTKG